MAAAGYPEAQEKWGGVVVDVPQQPGEVKVSWLQCTQPAIVAHLEEQYAPVVAEAARACAAALAQEADDTGFGQHVMTKGWHVMVVPVSERCLVGASLPCGVVLLSTHALFSCLASAHPGEALLYLIAHQMAPWYCRHKREQEIRAVFSGLGTHHAYTREMELNLDVPINDSSRETLRATAMAAGDKFQSLLMQHEREADEVAAAVLTRLRVPPSKVPTAAQAALHAEQELAAVVLWSR
ncbi:isopropylmalate isomerase [Micractinium conductrix]|uniref:Isopropylmalate isomerase n=1 Tax=Micractinium conductrix TaxID=554055 RepID=A0A2P6VKR8_9CHLO|nr:isopropylmalate isomerase [Micractinium conductrix]|eukprot:PSC74675.1 isopropylmalate isomerase [Micractinium conductrix]